MATTAIAAVRKKQRENDDDERTADIHRIADVTRHRVDEVRRTKQVGMEHNPLLLEARFQFRQGCFDAARHFHGVGAVLLGDIHDDPGLPSMAAPIGGSGASSTFATSPSVTRAAPLESSTVWAIWLVVSDCPSL